MCLHSTLHFKKRTFRKNVGHRKHLLFAVVFLSRTSEKLIVPCNKITTFNWISGKERDFFNWNSYQRIHLEHCIHLSYMTDYSTPAALRRVPDACSQVTVDNRCAVVLISLSAASYTQCYHPCQAERQLQFGTTDSTKPVQNLKNKGSS